MRLLITGKNGQVGFELARSLGVLGEVIALDRSQCDLENEAQLRSTIRDLKPDVVVNAAAYTAVDRAESEHDKAGAINGRAPGIIGEEAALLGALVAHYSTDYVFDGSGISPFREDDVPNPLSIYGSSKLAGERALAASGADHLIFRTSWVVGVHGNNFAKTMLRLAADRNELKVVADQTGAPTSARLIADVTAHAVRDVLRNRAEAALGVYHLAAGGETNWHAYAVHVIDAARKAGVPIRVAAESIKPISTAEYPTPAARPSNSRLDTSKLRSTFGLNVPSWQQEIDTILEQIIVKP
jgi:dTDP-4-dehydrorhamnose reductase